MKPIDIIPQREEFNGYSSDLQLYNFYKGEDSIIAYRKCFLGVVLLIKGRREMFGFLIFTKPASRWNMREMQRKKLRDIKKLFEEDGDEKLIIVNEEEYKIFERKVLFSGIIQNE